MARITFTDLVNGLIATFGDELSGFLSRVPSSLPLPETSFALAFVAIMISILSIVGMPVGAMRFRAHVLTVTRYVRAAIVFGLGYSFKMSRIHAEADAAEMVNMQSDGNRPDEMLISKAMSNFCSPVQATKNTIAVICGAAGPEPAGFCLLDFSQEAVGRRAKKAWFRAVCLLVTFQWIAAAGAETVG
jgi:hypothetical protein